MKERKTDLFATIHEPEVDAICITTNGQYTLEGIAAMGGGCAGVCARRWPETAVRLGMCLKNFGVNNPFVIGALDAQGRYLKPALKMIRDKKFKCLIISFPTIDDIMDGAKISLIKNSAEELVKLVYQFELHNIVIGRPGVGIGGLGWVDVKPVLETVFDDKYTIVSFEHEE